MTRSRLLQRGDVLLLRAAVLPVDARPTWWPLIDDPVACRRWLSEVWATPEFSNAVHAASPRLAGRVEQVIRENGGSPRTVRKATGAVARYLLRATGRPTPFGLFAGVATATCGHTHVQIGTAHRPVARPDTLWLDYIRRDLQGRPDVLPHLKLQANDLVARHGDVLVRPLPGGRTATVRLTRPLAAVLDHSGAPVLGGDLFKHLATLGGTSEQALQLVSDALDAGLMTSSLSAPMTDHDPLGHVLRVLVPVTSHLNAGTSTMLHELEVIHRLFTDHEAAQNSSVAARQRRHTEGRMASVCGQGRVRLSVDLRLDADVRVPERVLDEAEFAADALLRLTRNQGEKPLWSAYHTLFWERYGAGSLVPVREAADLAAGVGLPADFPMSLWPQPPVRTLPRDELLMAKAWQAAVCGEREIRLTDADLDALCDGPPSEGVAMAPHVEMGIRLSASSPQALEGGEFTLAVRPAWSTGTLTGRFAATLEDSDFGATYEKLPTLVEGALQAQLSFTPSYPHAENVARTPALLPYVIPIGEHREPAADLIPLDDLAVLSTSRRLHLVSLSRRRVVEPVVLHPLALEKQAPALARFIALVGRGFVTAWTQFDWGPSAVGLPYLPRVRYRKAILSPARWRLAAGDLPAIGFDERWHKALSVWARRWRCPQVVELRDDDRMLRLDLLEALHGRLLHRHLQRHGHAELLEAAEDDELGWIGHAHEFVVSLTSTQRRLPHPDIKGAPVVTNRMLSTAGDVRQPWLQAKLFTHPSVMDQILTRRLPHLLRDLGEPHSWFVRYRTPQEEDHLRLRIAAHGPAGHADAMQSLARWAAELQADGLAARLIFDGYRPEFGRYGTGPALAAAEDVFVADSETVRYLLTDLKGMDRQVLCALGMLDIARGFLGEEEGTLWMAVTPARGGIADPAVSRQARRHVGEGPLVQLPGWSERLDDAWTQRRVALGAYRPHLVGGESAPVLESLLHMHHNRVMGPDREAEAACRHAARQASRLLQARRGQL